MTQDHQQGQPPAPPVPLVQFAFTLLGSGQLAVQYDGPQAGNNALVMGALLQAGQEYLKRQMQQAAGEKRLVVPGGATIPGLRART